MLWVRVGMGRSGGGEWPTGENRMARPIAIGATTWSCITPMLMGDLDLGIASYNRYYLCPADNLKYEG